MLLQHGPLHIGCDEDWVCDGNCDGQNNGQVEKNDYFDGIIDEVIIYNHALDSSEILAHYNNGNGIDFVCTICGDENIDAGEICDGTNLNGETCQSQGFDSGDLSCLSDCSDFDTSACIAGTIYWADMNGNPITSEDNVEIGDTVLMIYQDMAGQNYDFEVYGDDITNEHIRTVTSFDFENDLAAKWVITQEDWDIGKDYLSETEFIFEVNTIESDSLTVLEDSFDNSQPQTQLINPITETDYVIRQGQTSTNDIDFEQISSDEDDDLKIKWALGGGEDVEFENCSTGTNCNYTHQYTTAGTKNIILTALEMPPRTPAQFARDNARIYVYGEGMTVFVILDQSINGRIVNLDATKTHVSDCDYVQGTCEGKYGGGNCYEVIDTIDSGESIWCYDLQLNVNGIYSGPGENINLFLDWTVDGVAFTPNQVGNEMKYVKVFDEPGEHIINLNVKYKL